MTARNFITQPGSQFLPEGTGAVERTVQSKLQDVVSVKDFGDGVADDTAAIQAAINSGAKAVYFPAGTYSISSTITLASNQTLYGDGPNVSVIEISGDWGSSIPLDGSQVFNASIDSLGFRGVTHSSSAEIVKFENTTVAGGVGPILRNLEFEGFNSYGVLFVQGEVTDTDWIGRNFPDPSTWPAYVGTRIEGINFRNNTVPAITFSWPQLSLSGVNGAHVSSIVTDNAAERSISVGYALNVEITGCKLNPVDNGGATTLAVGIYLRTTKGFKLSDCEIRLGENTKEGWGIRLSRGAYYGSITGIVTTCDGLGSNNTGGFGSLGGCDFTLSGCYFRTPSNPCIIAAHSSASLSAGPTDSSFAPAENIRVDGCIFETNSVDGNPPLFLNAFSVAGTEPFQPDRKNIHFTGCTFRNSASSCDFLARLECGEDSSITGCVFEGVNPEVGIKVARDNRIPTDKFSWRISDCTIRSDTPTTVSDAGATYGEEFTTCGIIYVDRIGNDGNMVVQNCDLRNWYTGIGLKINQDVLISGNRISNSYWGIRYDTSALTTVTVENNSISSSSGGCIAIFTPVNNSFFSRVKANYLYGSSADGILFGTLTPLNNLSVSHNTYEGDQQFLSDTPAATSNKYSHNLVRESVASDVPTGPVYAFNSFDPLSEYEEGTFTLTIADAASGGNTGTSSTCFYTKVGNVVVVRGSMFTINTAGLTAGNEVYFQGLPFAPATHNAVGSTTIEFMTFSGFVTAQCAGSATAFRLAESTSGSGENYLLVSDVTSGTADIVGFEITYTTT